ILELPLVQIFEPPVPSVADHFPNATVPEQIKEELFAPTLQKVDWSDVESVRRFYPILRMMHYFAIPAVEGRWKLAYDTARQSMVEGLRRLAEHLDKGELDARQVQDLEYWF